MTPAHKVGFITAAQAEALSAEAVRLDLQRQWLELGVRLGQAFRRELAARERLQQEDERASHRLAS